MSTYFFSDTFCIPVQKIDESIGILETFRDKNIIVFSRNGSRSKTATKILNENGINAYNIIVVMKSWE